VSVALGWWMRAGAFSVGHDPEHDHRLLDRGRSDDEGVEDLVVSEHRGHRVRAPHRADNGAHRVEHAAEPEQRQAADTDLRPRT